MFAKLLKYEWKAAAHMLLPLYLLVLAVSVVNRVVVFNQLLGGLNGPLDSLLTGIALFLYAAVITALFVVTLLVMLQRFYKGIIGDEGCLIMTIPVPAWQIPAAKCLVSLLFGGISMAVAGLSVMILGGSLALFQELLKADWGQAFALLQERVPFWRLYMAEGLLAMILMGASKLYQIYFCIMLGQLSNSHKLAFSFLWYVVIGIAVNVLTEVIPGFDCMMPWQAGMSFWEGNAVLQSILLEMILWSAVTLAVFAAGTQYLMRRRLNL